MLHVSTYPHTHTALCTHAQTIFLYIDFVELLCLIIYPHYTHCRSVNEVICHGIPDGRELQDGDICNGEPVQSELGSCTSLISLVFAVDISVYHGGFHSDLNETLFVGKVDDASHRLVETAYECMMKGIAIGESPISLSLSLSLSPTYPCHTYFHSAPSSTG